MQRGLHVQCPLLLSIHGTLQRVSPQLGPLALGFEDKSEAVVSIVEFGRALHLGYTGLV